MNNGSVFCGVTGTRITMISAMLVVVILIGIPNGLPRDSTGSALSPVGQSSASGPGDRTLTVGILNLQGSLGTLNPLFYNHEYEGFVFWPCYSTLLGYDMDRKYIGDLATWWEASPNGTLYHFKITSHATFYDRLHPSDVHRLTVYDIMFTYYLCQNNTNNMRFYFPTIDGKRVISNMWAVNDYEFYVQTVSPFAAMLNSFATVPILPQYIWSAERINWPNYDMPSGIPPIVGSGAWYYALDGMPTAGTVELRRSPTWFATEERGWQLRPSKLIYKSETSVDTSLNDLRTGAIDIYRFPSSAQFLNTLPGMSGVDRWGVPSAYVYEYAVNQMTNTLRSELGGKYNQGTNNQLLLDPVVKRALLMCLNRQGFVDGVLDGLGSPATSFISPLNPFHYDYGSRPGEVPIPFNPAEARALLNANDWKYDLSGALNPGATPLCKPGGQEPLRFRFYTPNDEPQWDPAARMIANWSWLAGIDLKTLYRAESQTFMNNAWFNADFDVWLWEWAFGTTSEASTDIMMVLTTDAIGSWSCSYWSNATYDSLYNDSLVATDYATRYEILADMQVLHYFESGDYAVAYRDDLWAATNGGPDRWTNWGNWSQRSILTPDSTTAWLYMQITPDETLGQNPAPRITSMQPSYPDAQVNVSLSLTASATDNGALVYRWFFGDGQKSGWLASPDVNHVYTKDGVYTAWLAVRESGTADNFTTLAKTEVVVSDMSNYAPTGVDFTFSPIDPDSGTIVYLNASATDPNGDPMTFSWDFGDGHAAAGQRVTHQFASGLPSYTVSLSVDDGHLGTGTRPVPASHLVPVTPNTAPTSSVPSYPHVVWKTLTNFSVTSNDPDARDRHRYTWDWGNGDINVTDTKWAWYSYSRKASYTLTVYADDMTGLPNHNVSGSNNVLVVGTNTVPVLNSFTVDNNNPNVGQIVTFTGSATDTDGDWLSYTFDFGDGNLGYANGFGSSTPLVLSVSHWYSAPGTYTAYLYVTDSYSVPLTSSPRSMNVVLVQRPPVVSPLVDVAATTGYGIAFTASATDPNGDPLVYTWDFGDATPLVTGSSVQHSFLTQGDFLCRVYVDDGTGYMGHNVSTTAWAHIKDFTINLVSGWNFVTIPLSGGTYKASNIGLQRLDVVVAWNPATKTYDKTYIVNVSPISLDITFLPSCGYWISTTVNQTLSIAGAAPSGTQTRTVTVTGSTWVNIGLMTWNTTWKASKIPSLITGATVSVVAMYDPVTKSYKTYIVGVPPSDYTLVPGRAVWVQVSGSCTLTYTP